MKINIFENGLKKYPQGMVQINGLLTKEVEIYNIFR